MATHTTEIYLIFGHFGATLPLGPLLFNLPFQSIITTWNKYSGDNDHVRDTSVSDCHSSTHSSARVPAHTQRDEARCECFPTNQKALHSNSKSAMHTCPLARFNAAAQWLLLQLLEDKQTDRNLHICITLHINATIYIYRYTNPNKATNTTLTLDDTLERLQWQCLCMFTASVFEFFSAYQVSAWQIPATCV